MPSEFINIAPLSGSIVTYTPPLVGRTDDQINVDLAKLVSNGVSGGTLHLGAYVPTIAGMFIIAQLVGLSWTIDSACAIVTTDTTFTVNEDGTWKVEVAAVGDSPTYQWQYRDPDDVWNNDAGKTSATYSNPRMALSSNAVPGGRCAYRCAITDNAVTVYSSPVEVDVPDFQSGIPANVTVNVGAPLQITVDFSDDPNGELLGDTCYAKSGTDYQWLKDGVEQSNDVGRVGLVGSLADGEMSAVLSIDESLLDDDGDWVLRMTDVSGVVVNSRTVVITVSP